MVPLYDSFGGSVLLTDEGVNTDDAAYPPLCGTRYVASIDAAVSEWMFCTDRDSQTCGDTDAEGRLVGRDGNPVNQMTGLDANPKLTSDQERLIAYLIQHGHSYEGTGSQSWGGATVARSDIGTNERNALQTLVWCISDPPAVGDDEDYSQTCADNMDQGEQSRLLAMIPESPELQLAFSDSVTSLAVGAIGRFTLSTNVLNQPITVSFDGTASVSWSVCAGDASLRGALLTVAGTNSSQTQEIVLCATASSPGTASVRVSATPPSVEHVGWSQSVNGGLEPPCQVYATFHEELRSNVVADALTTFLIAPTAPARVDTAAR